MVSGKKKAALVQTSEDFASRTSIHGVAYAFDRDLGLMDRLLWILVVIAFLLLASYFTANSWIQWREEQVTGLDLYFFPPHLVSHAHAYGFTMSCRQM